MNCLNCNTLVLSRFCPSCGQKTSVTRIRLASLLKELPHAVFHVDKGFLFNFTRLFRQPAVAIRDYLEGKRKPFFHPASYLVLALVLNYVVVKVIDLHFYDAHELHTMSPAEAAAIQAYDQMQWWFLEHTYIYILLAIPVSSFFLWLLLRLGKQPYNYAEAGVIVLFVIAQGVLLQSLIYALFGWYPSGKIRRTIEIINSALLILYASWVIYGLFSKAIHRFYRGGLALIAGGGLLGLWIVSAYVLFRLLS